jgi:hypothetical protein
MSPGGEPITKCPVCRYDLTGLPKNHRCPECGFEYDETMVVWNTRASGWTRWYVPCFVIVVWSHGMWRQLEHYLSGRGNPDWLNIGMGFILPGAVVFWVLTALRGGIVVFGKNGFSYRFPFGRLRSFRWDEVTISRAGRLPRRRARRWLTLVSLPTGVMSEPDLQGLLFQMYDRSRRFYQDRGTQPGPST